MENTIPLSQKLYLLGIHPEKGGIVSSAYSAMDYIILGTLFLELFQQKNIRFENKRIVVLNTKADSEVHRFLLKKFSTAKSPLKISRWINKLYFSLKYIRKEVQQGLVEKRLIKMESRRFLFFKWKTPVVLNKQAVYRLESEIESQIFKGTVQEEELLLLSFIKPAGLLRRLFPEREKRKKASQKLKSMMVDNQVSQAVADAISAAQAVAASAAASAAVSASVS
uniref:GOLPH3/VPS74 family protein n=1 Tax=uncultured Draconibacterium sp. TaxID=1573823 RepID=UPI003217C91F